MIEPTRRSFVTAAIAAAATPAAAAAHGLDHPHLYHRPADVPKLQAKRDSGIHALIWKNMRYSAEEFLTLQPPSAIPHGRSDILYHDLYVMFYHSLETMAMLEHFTYSWVISGDRRYFEHARKWMNAIHGWERKWGTPYLFSRYLHSIAVFYDACYSQLTESEQGRIRNLLAEQMLVYEKDVLDHYLGDPRFSAHHASIYFGCGGVAALALMGEVPEAERWLSKVKRQFQEAILPFGYGIDGGQEEGKTFWASQNLYRFFFLDALRNTTGEDWYEKFHDFVALPTDYGVHSFLGGEIAVKEYFDNCENIAFSADYGQLNYYAPPLLRLASEYRNPHAQWVAFRDRNLGRIQKSLSGVPGVGQKVLFCQGPYAYLWCDETLKPEKPATLPLARHFRCVEQVIMRSSWDDDALIMGLEGRSSGSAAVTDFMLHYAGKTIVSYHYLEGRNLPHNQASPNTLEFRGTDQLDAVIDDFFSAPSHHYATVDARKYTRHVFFLLPHTVLMVDEVTVIDTPASEIRWQLHCLGEITLTGPGQADLSVENARMRMTTLYPAEPAYRVRRSTMSKTTGGGHVKLLHEDPREFPTLDFPLKPEKESMMPLAPTAITVFRAGKDEGTVAGDVSGGGAWVKLGTPSQETVMIVKRDRAVRISDVFMNGKACLIRRSEQAVESFTLHNGSVLMNRGATLCASDNLLTLALERRQGGMHGSYRAGRASRVELACASRPSGIQVDGQAMKSVYQAGKAIVTLPAGTHSLVISA